MTRFAIIGAGWRSEFFLRIAQECPGRFEVTSVLGRNPEKTDALGAKWSVAIAASLEDLPATSPDFVMVSLPWATAPEMTLELSKRGVPVPSETPPASRSGCSLPHRQPPEPPLHQTRVATGSQTHGCHRERSALLSPQTPRPLVRPPRHLSRSLHRYRHPPGDTLTWTRQYHFAINEVGVRP